MLYRVDFARVLEILSQAESDELVDWAIQYGVCMHGERIAELVPAAIAVAQREERWAHGVFRYLAERWPRNGTGKQLRALLPHLSQKCMSACVAAIVECEGEGAKELALQHFGAANAEASENYQHLWESKYDALQGLADVHNALDWTPELAVIGLLRAESRTPASIAQALQLQSHAAPSEDHEAQGAADEAYYSTSLAFGAGRYASFSDDEANDRDAHWESADGETGGLVHGEAAKKAWSLAERGKGEKAGIILLDSIGDAAMERWRAQFAIRTEAGLAANILALLRGDRVLCGRLCERGGQYAWRLIVTAAARCMDEQRQPPADPAQAPLDLACRRLGSDHPHVPQEEQWIQRAVEFGNDAVEALKEASARDTYAGWRAMQVMGRAATPRAIEVLLAARGETMNAEWAGEALNLVPAAARAPLEAGMLERILADGDWDSISGVLQHWPRPGPESGVLADVLAPHYANLISSTSEDAFIGYFLSFHPRPEFTEIVAREGDSESGRYGALAEVLLAVHRPGDARVAETRAAKERIIDRFKTEDLRQLDYCVLPLRCLSCGRVSTHKIKNINVIEPLMTSAGSKSQDAAMIVDAVKCPRCRAIDDYEWTAKAKDAFKWQFFATGIAALNEKHQSGDGRLGPYQICGGTVSSVGSNLTVGESLRRLEENARANPDDPDAQLRWGTGLFNARRLKAALAVYEALAQRWPDHAEARYQLALAMQRAERHDRALEEFAQAARGVKSTLPAAALIVAALREDIPAAAELAGKAVPRDALDALERVAAELPAEEIAAAADCPPLQRRSDYTPVVHPEDIPPAEPWHDAETDWPKPVKTIVATERVVGPNERCPCGSGKKYKKCCGRI